MEMNEQAILLMARQRIEEALREAELSRALALRHAPRRSLRVRLGSGLVWIGQRILGPSLAECRLHHSRHVDPA